MKIKILLLAGLLIISSLALAQTDTVKTLKVKNKVVEIGKYYQIIYPVLQPERGKLIGVNKLTILMLIDNKIEEIDIADIEKLKEVDADNIIYTAPNANSYKTIYSLSAGYIQRKRDNYDYYSMGSKAKFGGFNIMGDALIRTSDNFGFRLDFSYNHIFGKTVSDRSTYYSGYDSAYYRSETVYSDMNIIAIKTGIVFGSMKSDEQFNFYMYLGLGFGWLIKNDDLNNNYITRNNVTTLTSYPNTTSTGMNLSAHGQMRISYKISKKYSVFVEPTFQYWGNKIDQLYGINGGITFNL